MQRGHSKSVTVRTLRQDSLPTLHTPKESNKQNKLRMNVILICCLIMSKQRQYYLRTAYEVK